jgi:hypothetical protein
MVSKVRGGIRTYLQLVLTDQMQGWPPTHLLLPAPVVGFACHSLQKEPTAILTKQHWT